MTKALHIVSELLTHMGYTIQDSNEDMVLDFVAERNGIYEFFKVDTKETAWFYREDFEGDWVYFDESVFPWEQSTFWWVLVNEDSGSMIVASSVAVKNANFKLHKEKCFFINYYDIKNGNA